MNLSPPNVNAAYKPPDNQPDKPPDQQPNNQPTSGTRRRAPPRLVSVTKVATLSPAMRRITLHSQALADFPAHLPASYIKLIFPEIGHTQLPVFTPDGPRPSTMRTYTPRHFNFSTFEMEVDFVLHGAGPASSWAAQAAIGQSLLLMGPGPGYAIASDAASYLLLGDDSALPALETIASALPKTRPALALIEAIDEAEQRPLASIASALSAHWFYRGTDHKQAGKLLEQALRAHTQHIAELPKPCMVYLACEAAAMRHLRQLLIENHGFERSQITARGYWKLGAVNHPDHDYGD